MGTWRCRECGMVIDDRISIGEHYYLDHGLRLPPPPPPRPVVSSPADGGPKAAVSVLPPAAPEPDPTPTSIPASDPYIQVAGWVLSSRVDVVIKAFKEARR